MEQISLHDILPEKQRRYVQPEIWNCVKTCAKFTNVRPDGSKDYFPGPGNVPRCVNLKFGTSKTINNIWHSWCLNYKEKE